jgi:hypothetical protein
LAAIHEGGGASWAQVLQRHYLIGYSQAKISRYFYNRTCGKRSPACIDHQQEQFDRWSSNLCSHVPRNLEFRNVREGRFHDERRVAPIGRAGIWFTYLSFPEASKIFTEQGFAILSP